MKYAVLCLAIAGLSLGINGCGSRSGSSSTPPSQPSAPAESHNGHGGHDHGDPSGNGLSAMEKMKQELAKLSPEDAASAEKQHFCPVSGEMLGTMGPPIKIDVNGEQVWICCDGCREELLENPDDYLAKLKR